MFKKLRGFLRKLGIVKQSTPTPKTVTKPSIPKIDVVTRPPTPGVKRVRVRNHILSLFNNAKKANVDYRLKFMTPDELTWTFYAKRDDIRNKARQAPDREGDDDELLNPWWYK